MVPHEDRIKNFLIFWGAIIVLAIVFVKYGSFLIGAGFFSAFLRAIGILAPFWVPIILIKIFFDLWMRYSRIDFIKKEGSVLLEIRMPEETKKTPLAMEIFFSALYQTGSASLTDAFWKGKIRPYFSLEIVSLGGEVRFFIWTMKKYKNLIESQLYAQYPNVEVVEAKDYTTPVYHDPEEMPLWATYFKLSKPDAYPIKTYVDYGMDKPGEKEEFKTDPISSVLEYMGSISRDEQIWIQILIQAHRTDKLIDANFFRKESLFRFKTDWTKDIDDEIKKIMKTAETQFSEGSEGVFKFPRLTSGQELTIKALERSRDKLPFETCIRGFYIAKKGSFNPINITGLIGSFRQYSSQNLNGLKLGWFTDYDYPWEDYKRMRRNRIEKEMLEAYKLRSFFQPPYKYFHQKPFIMTTEELATIYHLPGGVVQTPTFERIMSKKAEPPHTLPI